MTMYPRGGPPAPPPAGGPPTGWGPAYPTPAVCTWHPDRPTSLTCSRCGRPACPACLTPAAVGFHCRACVAEARGTRRITRSRTVAGAPPVRRPRVTYVLIAVNVAVFLAVALQSRSLDAFDTSAIFNGSTLTPMAVASGQWWRIVTSGFLHLSIEHIGLNMLALYFVGVGLERVLGTWRYLVLYLLSLLGGSAAVMLFAEVNSSAAGASGAIFGLFGALLVTLRRLRLNVRSAVVIIAINLIASFAIPGISWQAHIGGLVVGTGVGAALVYAPVVRRTAWQIGVSAAALVVVVGLIATKDALLGPWTCVDTFRAAMRCLPPS